MPPPPSCRCALRPMYQNRPTSRKSGRRLIRIAASVVDPAGFPTIWTLCCFSSCGSALSCSATGIWEEYVVPSTSVPETAPFASMVADLTWSAETLLRNWE